MPSECDIGCCTFALIAIMLVSLPRGLAGDHSGCFAANIEARVLRESVSGLTHSHGQRERVRETDDQRM